ncbi:MAG: DMT family transporter [Sphaerobacter sp.]|nr:DMT family transporter [Sphaerobacter sp.]
MIVLSAIGFAGTPTLARLAYDAGLNVPTTLTLRFSLAALLLWPLLLRRQWALPRRRLGGLALSSLLFAANTGTFFLAIRYAPATTVAVIFYSYPAVVTLLSILWLGERVTPLRATALGLAMLGCLLTLGFDLAGTDARGMLLAFASGCCYAGYIVLSSRVARDIPVIVASTWIMSGMGLLFGGGALLTGSLTFDFAPRGWFVLGILVVGGTVVAVLAFLGGIMRLGPSRAAIIATLEPVMAVALAALVLREGIGPLRALGGVAILVAVLLLRLPMADAPRGERRGGSEHRRGRTGDADHAGAGGGVEDRDTARPDRHPVP